MPGYNTPDHPDIAYIMRNGCSPWQAREPGRRCLWCDTGIYPGDITFGGVHRECLAAYIKDELVDDHAEEIAALLGLAEEVG